MSRILVTGWAGYIGPVVVRHLKAAGHEIVGLDIGWFLPDFAEAPEYPHVNTFGDIRDMRGVAGYFDAVVHLAGLSNDPMGDIDPDLTQEINEKGTLGILWMYPNARHVVVSSCSVYGHNDEIATEASAVRPLTAYARAKAAVDDQVSRFAACLRLGTVWGYSPGHRLDLVVNKMMFDAIESGVVRSQGDAWRPIVHVEDVASAVTQFVSSDASGIYNIVAENVRVREVAALVAAHADVRHASDDKVLDRRDYRASGHKARATGWMPSHYLEDDGSLNTLYTDTALLPAGQYVRLTSLRRLQRLGLLDQHLRRAA